MSGIPCPQGNFSLPVEWNLTPNKKGIFYSLNIYGYFEVF